MNMTNKTGLLPTLSAFGLTKSECVQKKYKNAHETATNLFYLKLIE